MEYTQCIDGLDEFGVYDYFYEGVGNSEYYYAEAGSFYCHVTIHGAFAKCNPDCPGTHVEQK